MSDRCGTDQGYHQHVRERTEKCDPCRRAHADEERSYRKRLYLNRGPLLVDATGTRRRLQALGAIGYSQSILAERLGISRAGVQQWYTRKQVTPATVQKIAALYNELSMIPGPNDQARRTALAAGWVPPLAWDDDKIDDPRARPSLGTVLQRAPQKPIDEIAVSRAVRGEKVHLRPVERAEAVRRLTAHGLSAAEIAARLGITPRAVTRLRAAA